MPADRNEIEVTIMSWKTIYLQLIKGYIFSLNGDSAPFFRSISHKSALSFS